MAVEVARIPGHYCRVSAFVVPRPGLLLLGKQSVMGDVDLWDNAEHPDPQVGRDLEAHCRAVPCQV